MIEAGNSHGNMSAGMVRRRLQISSRGPLPTVAKAWAGKHARAHARKRSRAETKASQRSEGRRISGNFEICDRIVFTRDMSYVVYLDGTGSTLSKTAKLQTIVVFKFREK